MSNQLMQKFLEKFSGCDSGEKQAGSVTNPSIWVFGIEFGTFKGKHEDDGYSIKTQLNWRYNKRVFKLLAAINGYDAKEFKDFATKYKPFERSSEGYFKGNLYPCACHNLRDWPDENKQETGLATKDEYVKWCKEYRLPAIHKWVDEHQPKILIGLGIMNRNDFSEAVFGKKVDLKEHSFVVNSYKKRLFYKNEGKKKLVVVPHSGRYGLNSYESLQKAGHFIAGLL